MAQQRTAPDTVGAVSAWEGPRGWRGRARVRDWSGDVQGLSCFATTRAEATGKINAATSDALLRSGVGCRPASLSGPLGAREKAPEGKLGSEPKLSPSPLRGPYTPQRRGMDTQTQTESPQRVIPARAGNACILHH